MDEIHVQRDMNDSERLMFQSAMNSRRKNTTTAVLLCLFLGGLGAHRFYMGETGWGVAYILFCWTFIPALIAFIELFLLSGRVRHYNSELARETAAAIKTSKTPRYSFEQP